MCPLSNPLGLALLIHLLIYYKFKLFLEEEFIIETTAILDLSLEVPCPSLCNWIRIVFSNDLGCEVHAPLV